MFLAIACNSYHLFSDISYLLAQYQSSMFVTTEDDLIETGRNRILTIEMDGSLEKKARVGEVEGMIGALGDRSRE